MFMVHLPTYKLVRADRVKPETTKRLLERNESSVGLKDEFFSPKRRWRRSTLRLTGTRRRRRLPIQTGFILSFLWKRAHRGPRSSPQRAEQLQRIIKPSERDAPNHLSVVPLLLHYGTSSLALWPTHAASAGFTLTTADGSVSSPVTFVTASLVNAN